MSTKPRPADGSLPPTPRFRRIKGEGVRGYTIITCKPERPSNPGTATNTDEARRPRWAVPCAFRCVAESDIIPPQSWKLWGRGWSNRVECMKCCFPENSRKNTKNDLKWVFLGWKVEKLTGLQVERRKSRISPKGLKHLLRRLLLTYQPINQSTAPGKAKPRA